MVAKSVSEQHTILEIDVGNSCVKWRLRGDDQVAGARGRVATHSGFSELKHDWKRPLTDILIASVASDAVNEALCEVLSECTSIKPSFAQSAATHGDLRNSYADPSRMGVDRWLAMIAAWERCHQACCVVDCGSAITVDFIAQDGQHEGGFILPGMRVLQSALIKNTAHVIVEDEAYTFNPMPGCDTNSAVRQGADFILDAIQLRLTRELEIRSARGCPARLFITGGDGELFQRLMGRGLLIPELVLDGLQLAF